jgi:hypothetical protein
MSFFVRSSFSLTTPEIVGDRIWRHYGQGLPGDLEPIHAPGVVYNFINFIELGYHAG